MIAMVLHGGIAIWLALPTPVQLPEPPAQPLIVSLLAAVGEITTPAAVSEPPPEPIPEPVLDHKPAPVPPPEPVPEPVVQKVPPEPLAPVKPVPVVEPEPIIKSTTEPAQIPEPIQEIVLPSPMESGTAPLDTAAIAQYEQLLRAWLEKYKIYPRHAQRLRIEGEGMLRILIDRTGRMQRVALEARTGNRLLDKAALKMARLADPFPPIPENDSRRELEFIVPVVFSLH